MYLELIGMVPKLPVPLAKILINRAWKDVRRQNLWSFQLYEGGWITPPLINTGTVTVTQGTNTVTADATAAVAITAGVTAYSTIPQRQFRVAGGVVYNIVSWVSPTLTLDRIYGEGSQVGASYQVLQVYYAPPHQDHLMFVSVRNMANFINLFLDKTRSQIDAMDPQRTWYYFPTDVVFYQMDPIPTSTTYRYPLYELWGVPQSTYNYNLYGVRKGVDLSANTDELPPVIGEDCVVELAKYYAYQWAEARKDTLNKGGPDFKYLMGGAMAEHKRLMKDYRRQDRETVNQWLVTRRVSLYGRVYAYYSSLSGMATPGLGWGG
jgi:hypothetical protein